MMKNLTIEKFTELMESEFTELHTEHDYEKHGERTSEETGYTTKYGAIWCGVKKSGLEFDIIAEYSVQEYTPDTLVVDAYQLNNANFTIDGDTVDYLTSTEIENLIGNGTLPELDKSQINEQAYENLDGEPVYGDDIEDYVIIERVGEPDLVFDGDLLSEHELPEHATGVNLKTEVYKECVSHGQRPRIVTVVTEVSHWQGEQDSLTVSII